MKLIELLERRLDNVVYRLGFAPTRLAARQMVLQSHIAVNGKKVVSPGYEVRIGDHIAVREGSKLKGAFAKRKEFSKNTTLRPGSGLIPKSSKAKCFPSRDTESRSK